MRSPNPRVSIVLLASLLLISCGRDDQIVDPGAYPPLLPLQVGNSWTFNATHFDTSGAITVVDTLEFKVLKDSTIQGQLWYLTTRGFYRNSPQGLWFLDEDKTPTLIYRYPGSPGDQYIGSANTSVQIISVADSKVVPSGIRVCYHYRLTTLAPNQLQTDDYFSPGVGWVSFELVQADAAHNKFFRGARCELVSAVLH
jgi:hypothetical protein